MDLLDTLAACDMCAARFAATATVHAPNPIFRIHPDARVLIASQAPGARAHASSTPFDDPSGIRLRDWMGVDEATFYDATRIAIVPMGFCFPGYDAKGSDLPPPAICARTWRADVLALLPNITMTLLVGGYAQKWHLGTRTVTETVRDWRAHAPRHFPLPHPSWRNTAWLKRNPWFEHDLVPELRRTLRNTLA